MAKPIKPMCFVAMPFGKKSPPGKQQPEVDFGENGAIYTAIREGVEAAGIECHRADFEPGGGFIHKPMFERLLLAEYVVADLTLANPNVAYEIGVRHAGTTGHALLIRGVNEAFAYLPFDFAPLRVLEYAIEDDGKVKEQTAATLAEKITERLRLAREGKLPPDNPILQITSIRPRARVEHEKTDIFQARTEYVNETEEKIAKAARDPNSEQGIALLDELAEPLLETPDTVSQLFTVLTRLFLGYREHKAYQRMIDVADKMPEDLRRQTFVKEQLALASNRLAEAAAKAKDDEEATRWRNQALDVLAEIPEEELTSETYGIRGRLYKGHYQAEERAGRDGKARAMLAKAIETYEQGLRADPGDYYPGVNAVTLRLTRGSEEDLAALGRLVPVVRFAADCAPAPTNDEERYWQTATKLELAGADRDWDAADALLVDLLGIEVPSWMHETTAANLRLQQEAFADDAAAVKQLKSLIDQLS